LPRFEAHLFAESIVSYQAFTNPDSRSTIHLNMFCPSCGTEDTIGLPYCNRCGANLGGMVVPQTEPPVISVTKPTLIISLTLAVLTLGGFAGLVEGARALSLNLRGGNNDPLIALIVMGMITILTVDVFLVRQLSRVITAALSSTVQPQSKRPNAIAAPHAPQLQRPNTARLEPAPSVTENTTRFFEPVYRAPAEAKEPANREELEK
jgi:hypothetical protein